VFEYKKVEVTGNKGFGFDCDRYFFDDCMKEDDNRWQHLAQAERIRNCREYELAKFK